MGTRGSPKRRARDVRQLIVAPRREHSRKPDDTYERIERLLGGPYLELFARHSREGWDSWGHQARALRSPRRRHPAVALGRGQRRHRPAEASGPRLGRVLALIPE